MGGSIGWYEAWAAGDWSSPDPVPLFDLFMRNRTTLGNVARAKRGARLAARAMHLLRRNDRRNARRNIAAHYDLGNDFYEAWLDPSLTYSSALFAGDEPLEHAQRRKIDAILDRAAVPPGGTLLEIGCGWGALAEAAREILQEAGYRQRRDSRELVLVDPENNVEFFYLRPRDIAVYVGQGTLDVGLTGRDLFCDAQVGDTAEEIMALGFGRSVFRLAAPVGSFTSAEQLAGKRIATSYDGLLSDYLARTGLDATVVHLDGAVESSVKLGVADAIADVVETGSTLRAAGMEVFGEPILDSEAVLIGRAGERPEGLDVLLRRLKGVLVARRWVMIDYDIRRDLLEAATAVTPGLESPTVSPLRDETMVAVRSMVRKPDANRVMDELYALGARGILISAIHAIRL